MKDAAKTTLICVFSSVIFAKVQKVESYSVDILIHHWWDAKWGHSGRGKLTLSSTIVNALTLWPRSPTSNNLS